MTLAAVSNSDRMDRWVASEQTTFETLEKTYHIERGDWILEQKLKEKHTYWVFYRPQKDNINYNIYYLGFSGNPNSMFYHAKKFDRPIIIKNNNQDFMRVVRRQLNAL